MTVFLSEHIATCSDNTLCVTVELQDSSSADSFVSRLNRIQCCGTVEFLPEKKIVLVQAASGVDIDSFLTGVETAISAGAVNESGCAAEIVEARLCSTRFPLDEMPLSERFSICRQEEDIDADTAAEMICLGPGNAFGSGRHPSTRLTVKVLEQLAAPSFPRSVLDIGCGSGILTFVCHKLGAKTLLGLDISDEAISLAQENARRNRIAPQTANFLTDPVESLSGQFELIVANLSPSVLMGVIPHFPRLAIGGTRIVLSGFQTGQEKDIATVAEKAGFAVLYRYADPPWLSLLLG